MNKSPSFFRLILPGISELLFIAVFLSVLASGQKMLNIDGDLPRHLLMGKIVLDTGAPPMQEIFSYVYEGRSYTPHEWLAGMFFYLAYAFQGLNGVMLVSSALIAITFWLIYIQAKPKNDKTILIFVIVLLGALSTSIHWVVRPHLFTMLFLAIWLVMTDRLRRGLPVKFWVFPLIMLIWSNTHAEYIAGFLILIAHIAGWFWQFLSERSKQNLGMGKKLLSITIVSFGASSINPAGFHIWDVVFGYINNRYLISHITETRPPDFTQPEYLVLLLLLVSSAVIMMAGRKTLHPSDFFIMIGFGAMSLFSARNVHLFGVVAPYVLSHVLVDIHFQHPRKPKTQITHFNNQMKGKPWTIVIIILIGSLLVSGPLKSFYHFEPSVFPVDAVQWLENHPQSGRMFNDFDWGGYILFHLWPNQKVFIESQTDVTGEVTQKYETVITLKNGWQNIMDEYEVTWAILPTNSSLSFALSKNLNWETIYQDSTAVILQRTQ